MSVIPPLSLAIVLAGLAEGFIGELPRRIHPVALFGRAVGPIDRTWTAPQLVGGVLAVVAPLLFGTVAGGVVLFAGTLGPIVMAAAAGSVLFVTTSLRLLVSEATAVIQASETAPNRARERLPALVGRDPDTLSSPEIRSAAVESAAENLADGLIGPLTAFVIFGLVSVPLGAAAATWVKGINTLDSMFGYPTKPIGTVPARLDDIVMWVPARLSALLLTVCSADLAALTHARRASDRTASPNAGWPMGALAGALAVRLEKPTTYQLNPDADLPDVTTSLHGIRLVTFAGVVAYLIAAVIGVFAWI